MNKTVFVIAISIMLFSHVVPAEEHYKSGREAYYEWLMLNTCKNYAFELKKKDPSIDADNEFFVCVQEAKKQAAINDTKKTRI